MTQTADRIVRISELIVADDVTGACDLIVALARDGVTVPQEQADAWMDAVTEVDPALSGDGAHLRDTLRDNFEHLEI